MVGPENLILCAGKVQRTSANTKSVPSRFTIKLCVGAGDGILSIVILTLNEGAEPPIAMVKRVCSVQS
jgi:hypothetical protein